ncbi:MAG: hypothetical protein K2H76_08170 [Muribaculaceae bacterium]|nr:hypothetical protein [Muribaculaceae bacterium]
MAKNKDFPPPESRGRKGEEKIKSHAKLRRQEASSALLLFAPSREINFSDL